MLVYQRVILGNVMGNVIFHDIYRVLPSAWPSTEVSRVGITEARVRSKLGNGIGPN